MPPTCSRGGNDVLAPFSTVGLSLRITSVASDGNGNAFVYWSCGSGALPPYAAKSAVTTTPSGGPISALLNLYSQPIAGGLVANGTNTTVVMVESQYLYTAPARFIMKSEQKMVAAAYALPRVSAYIGFPWDGNQDDQPPHPDQPQEAQVRRPRQRRDLQVHGLRPALANFAAHPYSRAAVSASAAGSRIALTRLTRRPSISSTSNLQPPNTIRSPVRGTRFSSASSSPPSV